MSAKSFCCAFFQLAGTGGNCESDSFSLAKMSAKSFRCAFFQLAGTLKKGGSNINIPAKSTYVEFVPGFFDIKNWPGNTLLTLTLSGVLLE
jgi:hypothetical protein